MNPAEPLLADVHRSLYPIDAVPEGPPWNLPELEGLLDDTDPLSAAVLVGLVEREDGLQVLLTRRTDGLRQHAGQVSFPGGRVESADAGVLDAALREAREEIGLSPALATPLGYLDPMMTISGYRVVPVIARIAPTFVPRPDPGEVAAVFEVPLSFLMAPVHLRSLDIQFGGRLRHVLEFDPYPGVEEHRIWGVTASILFNLRQRLERRP